MTAVAIAQDGQTGTQQRAIPSQSEDLAKSALRAAQLEGLLGGVREENKRLRKKFIGPRTSEHRFALYAEEWRTKVERVGELNYPDAARGKLYGTVIATVEISSVGKLLFVGIDRPSGNKILDDAVRRIVMMAAPFAPFPPEIAQDTDIIAITRSWQFTNSEKVESSQGKTDTPRPANDQRLP